MGLLERVSTLIRANLNDMIDRAEDPEKMIKQVILDMQNQFMQVKTQVAIALADLHLLEKKRKENLDKETEWMRKAEMAVGKKDDALARAALERAAGISLQPVRKSRRPLPFRNAIFLDAGFPVAPHRPQPQSRLARIGQSHAKVRADGSRIRSLGNPRSIHLPAAGISGIPRTI